jgi:hypothetical protein
MTVRSKAFRESADKPFVLEMDASEYASGAILYPGRRNRDNPCGCFASRPKDKMRPI